MYKDVVNNLNLFDIKFPNTIVPSPTSDDYNLGFIMRYFIQKANDSNAHVFEIDLKTYELYKENPHWKVIEVKWRIKGPLNTTYKNDGEIDDKGVKNSNQAAINRASFFLKNVGLYLPNLLQFHKN
jgi:hypothetical protein